MFVSQLDKSVSMRYISTMPENTTTREHTMAEPLKVRITQTANGQAPTAKQLKDCPLKVQPADDADPTWFWTFGTPSAAANIRANGHYAHGSLLTFYYPPQSADGTISDLAEPTAADMPMGVSVYDHGASEWVSAFDAHVRGLRVTA